MCGSKCVGVCDMSLLSVLIYCHIHSTRPYENTESLRHQKFGAIGVNIKLALSVQKRKRRSPARIDNGSFGHAAFGNCQTSTFPKLKMSQVKHFERIDKLK